MNNFNSQYCSYSGHYETNAKGSANYHSAIANNNSHSNDYLSQMEVENSNLNNYHSMMADVKCYQCNYPSVLDADGGKANAYHSTVAFKSNSDYPEVASIESHNSNDRSRMAFDSSHSNHNPSQVMVGRNYSSNTHSSVKGSENRPAIKSYRQPTQRSSPLAHVKRWFTLSKSILRWKQGDEDPKWAEKAIETLHKKLKNRKEDKAELERALAYPLQRSGCVRIPRSRDGRLQISHRKILPHVIFCRIYRWPDLQSHHELKPVDYCEYPFCNKAQEEICVNPYHYTRVNHATTMPTVVVSRYSERPSNDEIKQLSRVLNSGLRSPSHAPTGPPSYASMSPHSSGNPSPNSMNFSIDSPPPFSPESDVQQYYKSSVNCAHEQAQQVQGEPKCWASIKYFELHDRVGEIFHCYDDSTTVIVDGFTHPHYKTRENEYRFCLGTLSNVHRNSTIENTRRHIGKGVRFTWCNGMVEMTCLSEKAVFFHSWDLNFRETKPELCVHKLTQGESCIVFNSKVFEYVLRQRANISYESVYDLKKFCTIQMSFIKGWGSSYPRQDVSSTPCWLEIVLDFALRWLDKVLVEMKPTSTATSVS